MKKNSFPFLLTCPHTYSLPPSISRPFTSFLSSLSVTFYLPPPNLSQPHSPSPRLNPVLLHSLPPLPSPTLPLSRLTLVIYLVRTVATPRLSWVFLFSCGTGLPKAKQLQISCVSPVYQHLQTTPALTNSNHRVHRDSEKTHRHQHHWSPPDCSSALPVASSLLWQRLLLQYRSETRCCFRRSYRPVMSLPGTQISPWEEWLWRTFASFWCPWFSCL